MTFFRTLRGRRTNSTRSFTCSVHSSTYPQSLQIGTKQPNTISLQFSLSKLAPLTLTLLWRPTIDNQMEKLTTFIPMNQGQEASLLCKNDLSSSSRLVLRHFLRGRTSCLSATKMVIGTRKAPTSPNSRLGITSRESILDTTTTTRVITHNNNTQITTKTTIEGSIIHAASYFITTI